MREGYNESPINALPGVVWLLALPIIALEVVFGLAQTGLVGGAAGIGWRMQALQRFAFIPEVFERMLATGQFPAGQALRTVSYLFVHGSFVHAAFVTVFILALGKVVAESFGQLRFAVLFFGSGIAAAVIYALLPWGTQPLIGGYPAVYGLVGGFTFLLWTRLGQVNANRMRAFTLIGMLLMFQLVFGLLFGARPDWIADLLGFVIGFALSFLLAPGGVRAVLNKIRSR